MEMRIDGLHLYDHELFIIFFCNKHVLQDSIDIAVLQYVKEEQTCYRCIADTFILPYC